MATSDRVGLAGLVMAVLSPATWYLLGNWFIAALLAVVGGGLLLGWLSARLHGRFAEAVTEPEPPKGDE